MNETRSTPLDPGAMPPRGMHRVRCDHCRRWCACPYDVPVCLCDECHGAGCTPGLRLGCRRCNGTGRAGG